MSNLKWRLLFVPCFSIHGQNKFLLFYRGNSKMCDVNNILYPVADLGIFLKSRGQGGATVYVHRGIKKSPGFCFMQQFANNICCNNCHK